jgi:hypothetical protein
VNPDAPIICCTAEILANLALRHGADTDVGQVVMDEFHFYSDPERGWAWQVPLLTLPGVQFVLMSATLGDVTWLAKDLTARTDRETAVVTGDMVEGRSTETGVFSIYAMEQGVTLVGLDEDGDGQPDYESYVDYWMPFYGGLGLHDATWRYDFGGNLYSDNGSHGCVNLPHQKAAELYNMTFVGEKVYIHW